MNEAFLRLLHILSQRPGRTGSGVTLAALVRAASRAQVPIEQDVVVGVPLSEALALQSGEVRIADLEPACIHPLAFETEALPFPVAGMSDGMPYPSTVFGEMSPDDLVIYRSQWRLHLQEVLLRTRPEVIHVHHVWMVAALVREVIDALLANEWRDDDVLPPKIIVHSHATGLRQMKNHPALGESIAKVVRRHDVFLALHRAHQLSLVEALDIDISSTVIVGAGFDPKIFCAPDAPNEERTDIVYAGKLSAAKGLPSLLDAMATRGARGDRLRLVVCGGGDDDDARALIARMSAMKNVDYRGAVDHRTLASCFQRAAVFVLPSLYEGLPLVVAEALACGCRLVVTALPGVVETFVTPFGDALLLLDLPQLSGIDRLSADDNGAFAHHIDVALQRAVDRGPVVDGAARTFQFSWDGVAARILPLWLD